MKMKPSFFAAVCTSLLSWHAASAAPALPDSTLQFAVDYARFRITARAAYVELYVGVPRTQLRFVPDAEGLSASGGLIAAFESRVVISRGDSQLVAHAWASHSPAQDTSEIRHNQVLYTQASFQLPVGEYQFTVQVRDTHSGAAATKSFAVPVEPFEAENLALSDIEISARLMKDTTRSLFYKNRYTVIPNPNATYGMGLPMLYAYAEIYNLTFPSDSAYTVVYRILDGQGSTVKTLPAKRRPILGKQLVEVGAVNVVSLPSGTFFLELQVVDHATQKEAVRRHKFFVYREDTPMLAAGQSASTGLELMQAFYRQRPVEELEEEFKAVRYLATKEEQKIYASLTAEGKKDFFARFWQPRDRSPETLRNEFREDYLQRAKFANENFSGLRKGVETDMGRVLLVYDQPDDGTLSQHQRKPAVSNLEILSNRGRRRVCVRGCQQLGEFSSYIPARGELGTMTGALDQPAR
jgi:GWxTD domain-containing protein